MAYLSVKKKCGPPVAAKLEAKTNFVKGIGMDVTWPQSSNYLLPPDGFKLQYELAEACVES